MIKKPLKPHLESQFKKLPKKIEFCKRCVMSNQRPRISFDKEGICGPCRYTEMKHKGIINYKKRKRCNGLKGYRTFPENIKNGIA